MTQKKQTTKPVKVSVPKVFDSFDISIAINEYMETYHAVVALLLDEKALRIHFQHVEQIERNSSPEWYQELIKKADKYTNDGMNFFSQIRSWRLNDAIAIQSRQAIVTIVTLFEVMLFEFFNCLFCSYPERMYDFITVESNETKLKGKIDIAEIFQEENINNLTVALAARAAKTASQTSYRNNLDPLLKNMDKVSKSEIDKDLIKKMMPYIDIRNRIVHEGEEAETTSKYVMEAFDSLINILDHFESIMENNDIPTTKNDRAG